MRFLLPMLLSAAFCLAGPMSLAMPPDASAPPLPRPVAALLESLTASRQEALAAAARLEEGPPPASLDKQAAEAIIAAWLEGRDDNWTRNAVAVLESMALREPAVGEALVRLLEDPRQPIREAAIAAATRAQAVENPRILPLIASLRYAEPEQRYRAANYLGKFGRQAAPAAGALQRAAQDETAHAAVRWEAVFALRDMGEPGVPGLVAVVQTTEKSVVYKALESLAALGPKAEPAFDALVAALGNDDPQIRSAAAAALGRIPERLPQAVPALRRALDDSDRHVRDAAAAALLRAEPSRP